MSHPESLAEFDGAARTKPFVERDLDEVLFLG
jgi:hypothetical protein